MNKFLIAACIVSFTSLAGFVSDASAADIVPCEDMLQTARDALTAATTLAAADKTKVDELIVKGTERCNADDDKRADGFFTDAIKLMGK
jgi:hypothetical protein